MKDINSWWDSINYSQDEILGEISYLFNASGYQDPVVRERSGLTGKCFSVSVPDPLEAKHGLSVYLNFHKLNSLKREIIAYIHEAHNDLG